MSETRRIRPKGSDTVGQTNSPNSKMLPKRSPQGRAPEKRVETPRRILDVFSHWKTISGRLRAAEHVVLFLDFDGTLAPFCERPERVHVDLQLRDVLNRLVRHRKITIYVISGRRRADVESRLGVPGIRCLGLFGWEKSAGSWLTPAARLNLRRLNERLVTRLRRLSGVWIEDKKFSLVVHYRAATTAGALLAQRVVRDEVRLMAKHLRVITGSRVREILPREIGGKNRFVRETLGKLSGSALPIYVGDDASDEEAFQELPSGVSIHVGCREKTRARYRLNGPGEVRQFLIQLEREVE